MAALDTLRALRRGDLVDRALFASLERVSSRDRAWTHELVYGTLRLRGRLDYLLAPLVHQGLARLDADVLDILRLGAYQLLEMGSVPAYAAVSQSVELTKAQRNEGAARLVNAVLQALRRSLPPLEFPSFESDAAAHLTTWGSHPRWLIDRWIARFGPEETKALVEANNLRPHLYLRPIGVTVAEALDRLTAAGMAAEPVDHVPDSIHLLPLDPSALAALAVVPAVIQDPAATLIVQYASPPADAVIADLAAAPGGKALALAGTSDHTSPRQVVAGDISLQRIQRLRENVARFEGLPLGIIVADGRQPPLRDRAYDMVLLDAPCTGTGTFRRHPDGRWRVGERDLAKLVQLQRELLDAAAALVRPGGLLVYATCSLETEENELQVDDFLAGRPEFDLKPPAGIDGSFLDERGRLSVLPQRSGFDGAFAARLRRS